MKTPLTISIDATCLSEHRKTGVEYYTLNLVQHLLANAHPSSLTLAVLGKGKLPSGLTTKPKVTAKYLKWLPQKLYKLLFLVSLAPRFDRLAGSGADIFFFPNFIRWPLSPGKKSVVVVHDLAFVFHPETMVRQHQWNLKRLVPQSIAKATRVVAVSEHTKHQISRHYHTDPDKIDVVTPAINHGRFYPIAAKGVSKTTRQYNISKPYLLYLGTLEPRKNVDGIIRAYLELPEAIRQNYSLVLAGAAGWRDQEIQRLIAAIPPEQVVLTGYVDPQDVAALYTGATIFIYPSHYEGWGMQILEAMACGTPVITADNSSLPEVGGDAALYVDSHDTAALTSAILDFIASPAKRKAARSSGLERAAAFTWERSAQQLQEVLTRAMA